MVNQLVNQALKMHGLPTLVNSHATTVDDCHIYLFHAFMDYHEELLKGNLMPPNFT